MRLMLILTEFPPSLGGMQSHAVHLAQRLAAAGHQLEVFTHSPRSRELAAAAATCDGALPYPVHRTLSRLGFWHNVALIEQRIRASRPDLIYASTVFYGLLGLRTGLPVVCRSVGNDLMRPWMGYPFRAGSRLLAVPLIETLLRYWIEHGRYPDWTEALFRRTRHRLAEQAAREATLVLANSAYTGKLLARAGVAAERVDILPGGVDAPAFRPPGLDRAVFRRQIGLPADAFVVLTVCRLVAKKGLDILLRAIAQLRAEMPDLHLVVAGDGRYRARWQAMARQLGIGPRVTFAGPVPHAAIHPYYWCADAFALPSRDSVNPLTGNRDVETMGRVLCEANAAGVPLVASRSGGIPSVVEHGDNGLLFDENDLDGLIAGLRTLRLEKATTERLVAGGLRRAAREFDWQIIVARHETAFTRSCRGGTPEDNEATPAGA